MSQSPAEQGTAFQHFGAAHLSALGLIVALTAWMIWTARSGTKPQPLRAVEVVLSVLLFSRFPVGLLVAWRWGWLDHESFLPMHLCDIAAWTGGFALLKHDLRCAELTYFWGIAGTFNGLITPTLTVDFPHPAFLLFFWLHGGIVLTAAYLVAGAGLWPRPGAVRRVFIWTVGYAALAGMVNWLLGTNYGFLAAPPPTPSLIDVLGPWPWYVLSLVGLALCLFSLLYLPFHLLKKPRAERLDAAP
ncbi:MAG: TIGR02206 family membrane protein [Verrucomicrobiales bacterium]